MNHCAKDDIRTMMIHDIDDISAVSVFWEFNIYRVMAQIINFLNLFDRGISRKSLYIFD